MRQKNPRDLCHHIFVEGEDRALCGRNAPERIGDQRFCRRHYVLHLNQLIRHIEQRGDLRALVISAVSLSEVTATENRMRLNAAERRHEFLDMAKRVQVKPAPEVVYFVQRGDLVKIGITKHLGKRISEINRGSSAISGMTVTPVNLLASIPGGRQDEEALHRRFASLRVDGEWFRLDGDLREYIDGLAASAELCATG